MSKTVLDYLEETFSVFRKARRKVVVALKAPTERRLIVLLESFHSFRTSTGSLMKMTDTLF